MYCPLIHTECREDCALHMQYNGGSLCALSMAAHELFIIAENMTRPDAQEVQNDGDEIKTDL